MTHLVLAVGLAVAVGGSADEWEYGPEGWREAGAGGGGAVPDPDARGANVTPALLEQPMADTLGEPARDARPAIEFGPQFDDARRDLDAGRSKRAFKRTVDWLQANPGQAGYDQGLYLAALSLYEYGNRVKSFFYLDQLLDQYPESPLWNDAISLQYRIADDYLNGYKDRLLGIPLQSGTADAVEMLFRIRERVPLSPLGERALLRTGDYYYANEEYDLAALVYGTYLDRFGRSPRASRVKLRQAYANLLQFEGPRYDPTPIIDARTRLIELRQDDPALAGQAGADELLVRIDRQLAQKRLETADFYLRTGEPTAAALQWQAAVREHPGTPEAQTARERLADLGVEADAVEANDEG